jgi:hypothetical protein
MVKVFPLTMTELRSAPLPASEVWAIDAAGETLSPGLTALSWGLLGLQSIFQRS